MARGDDDSRRGGHTSRDRGDSGRDSGRGGRDSTRDSERSGRGGGRDDRGGGSRNSGRGGFTYQRRSEEDVRKRAEGSDNYDRYLKDVVQAYKPRDADNEVRLLPPTWDDARHYGLDIWVHYGVGPDRQTYLCLHKMKGEPCPVCEERTDLARDGDEKAAKELEPKRRVLVYLVDRKDEKTGLQAYAMPQTLDKDIVKVSVDKKSGEVLPIDHPDEGFDVMFEKSGSKDRTEYSGVTIARRESPLGDDAWLDKAVAHPLPDLLQYYSYDHIAAAFGGRGGHTNKHNVRDDHRDDDRGRSSSRDRDDDRGRSSGRDRSEPELTWESVHDMTGRELDALVASDDRLADINPNDAKDDADLADWICEVLVLTAQPARQDTSTSAGRTRVRADPPPAADDTADRLAQMRARRGS